MTTALIKDVTPMSPAYEPGPLVGAVPADPGYPGHSATPAYCIETGGGGTSGGPSGPGPGYQLIYVGGLPGVWVPIGDPGGGGTVGGP